MLACLRASSKIMSRVRMSSQQCSICLRKAGTLSLGLYQELPCLTGCRDGMSDFLNWPDVPKLFQGEVDLS